jgi:hypothetical protein
MQKSQELRGSGAWMRATGPKNANFWSLLEPTCINQVPSQKACFLQAGPHNRQHVWAMHSVQSNQQKNKDFIPVPLSNPRTRQQQQYRSQLVNFSQ